MQEIHSMGGGRFFGGGGNGGGGGGGGGGGDRRLRPNHHHQALKCPRCDSINTKFCYYNNYNLSQPRHFCKNCRRYWTKGGVLRNVPVGGGCRKSKRANSNSITKPSNNNSSSETPPEHNSNSHSSSESSSLTATTTTEAVSAPNNTDSKLLIPSSNPPLETVSLEQQGTVDCAIFSEIGSFTSLITSTNDTLQFGFGPNTITDTSSFQWQNQKVLTMVGADNGELKFHDNLNGGGASSLLDQGTVAVDLSVLQNKTGHGGFGSLDWNGGADQGLFDLSNTVDHTYWNPHTTHWSDHDNSTLFHLP
ncbi:hypothetical protein TanjilG_13287 [Lupinus angustifolius]|uniref:Dof zinc finger protein n=1 Tax=Lupinus angustifolius TaxID=3871 RepID=A0A4P1RUV0_LUPAN|nr:PREDICTED: dof zinc finger protein DOF5.4-like [Lupinus angustifolius]OIW18535.1 hypothetical protein TanjilG_13287 [Lupinus angustifolius]